MTSYNPACPNPSDIPRDSQDEFLMNFITLNSLYSTDHVPFTNNNPLTNGLHTKVSFEESLNPPNQLPNRSSIFPNTPNKAIDLFYQNTSSPVNLDNLTNNILTLARGQNGFITPWGLIINQTNSLDLLLASNVVTNLVFPVPFTMKIFFVIITQTTTPLGLNFPILVPAASTTGMSLVLDPTFVSSTRPVKVAINYFCMGI